MLSYQTLDTIADAYTPLLAILCLCFLIRLTMTRQWQRLLREGALLLVGLISAYAIMFTDQYFSLWPYFELDYSTHSAAALVLVVSLSVMKVSLRGTWLLSLLCYFLLMLYQQYHSVADIISTVLVVGGVMFPWALAAHSKGFKAAG